MKRIIMTAIAATLLGTSAFAGTFVREINVEADLNALENVKAAQIWTNIEDDLEEALATRLVDQIDEDGARIQVEMDTVALANSIEQRVGAEQSELTGRVHIKVPGFANNKKYNLRVTAEEAAIPAGTATLPIGSEEFYTAMVDAFADNIALKLQ